MTDEESVAIVFEVKDMALALREARDQRDKLRKALRATLIALERADTTTGYCCCGSPVESHAMGDGHSPVDEGEYYAAGAIEQARAALAGMEDGE